jgi:hypothetical protein
MPLTYKIDHEKRFVTVQTAGLVTLDDILVYYEALVVEEAMAYHKLFDASEGDIQLSDDDLMTLGAWVSAFQQYDPRGPIAILCTTLKTENTMRRYMNLGGAKRAVKTFRSRTRAMKWLGGEKEA